MDYNSTKWMNTVGKRILKERAELAPNIRISGLLQELQAMQEETPLPTFKQAQQKKER